MEYIEILKEIRPHLEKLYELGCGRVVLRLQVGEEGFDRLHREIMDDLAKNNIAEKDQREIELVVNIEHNQEFDKRATEVI